VNFELCFVHVEAARKGVNHIENKEKHHPEQDKTLERAILGWEITHER